MKFSDLTEASYRGNIGIMEIIKFHEIASKDMIVKLTDLIKAHKDREAWKLIQKVTGTNLKGK